MDMIKAFLNRRANHFLVLSLLNFILATYNILYKISLSGGLHARENLWNPSWLLFGPILYFSLQKAKGIDRLTWKSILLHFLPCIIFFIFFLIAAFNTNPADPWKSASFTFYQNSYLVILASLASYSAYTLGKLLSQDFETSNPAELLIMSYAVLYILISVVTFMLFFGWVVIKIDMGLDYRLFAYSFLAFANIATIWYWFRYPILPERQAEEDLTQVRSYAHSELPPEQAARYQSKIKEYFDKSTGYLTPSLSLENLSRDLDIPKHYLSQVFNVYFKKSFHNFLAEYRIAHAIKLLHEQPRLLKIESLANTCGFNSKTSFNKYFKEITGVPPSTYQENLITNQK